MGQFSWITQDTHEPIRDKYGCGDKSLTTAYMHDHLGNVWEEKEYEGYGEFGGKDFHELLAEMNNLGSDRDSGIDLSFSDKPFISPNLTRNKNWKWINNSPENDPNQGWGDEDIEEEEDNSLDSWFD
jgi:hypothetical protein